MNDKSTSKQLRSQFFRGNKRTFIMAVAGGIGMAATNVSVSWLLRQLIDTASQVPGAMPLYKLSWLCAGFVILCITVYMMIYVSEPCFIRRAMIQYKETAFRMITEKNIASFRDESTAAYLSALTNDAVSIETDYVGQQLSFIIKAFTFFGGFMIMAVCSPLLTALSVAATLLPIAASLFTGGKLKGVEQRVSDRNRDYTASLSDCLGGFTTVKSFRAENEIFELFAKNDTALEDEKFRRRRLKVIVDMLGGVSAVIAQLFVFICGTYLALKGRGITPGTVIMFVNLMGIMMVPISQLPVLIAGRRSSIGLIEKLSAALEQNSAVSDGKEMTCLEKGIKLDNVSFGYEDGREVLHDISAEFQAGKAYAIVGGSGSGKSTMLSLLMAGSSDYSGSIYFDDTELKDICTGSLYDLISVIQQNVFVFNATVKDNVTMFRRFAKDIFDSAVDRAHLKRFLADHGEDYLCGENGSGLSGGEKQRISIARSLLKSSSVLLADEATAALDAQTAYQVTGDILGLDGITRIIVTHSLEKALLERYDEILVMKDGRIAESGSFDELLDKKGYFYALYTLEQ